MDLDSQTGTNDGLVVPAKDVDTALKDDNEQDAANKAYDRGDLEEAKTLALKVLDKDVGNVRMRRIVVSSACQIGEEDVAQASYLKLPKRDRDQMQSRCSRFGVTFKEP